MSKMIQIRNVPDALHRVLKARAAKASLSLSDYLLTEIKEIAEKPTLAEMRRRLHTRKPFRRRSIPLALCEKSAKVVIALDSSTDVDWRLRRRTQAIRCR